MEKGEVTKEVGYVEIKMLEDNMKEQDPKRRRKGILKVIEMTNEDPCKKTKKTQESHLLTRGLQATYKLGGLNVKVQNITILYQGLKQYKN